jgi:hypothetical protein
MLRPPSLTRLGHWCESQDAPQARSEIRHVSFQQSVSPDGLHMNDWSYGCMAKLLADTISDASTRVPQIWQDKFPAAASLPRITPDLPTAASGEAYILEHIDRSAQ